MDELAKSHGKRKESAAEMEGVEEAGPAVVDSAAEGGKIVGVNIQRYKGLGEMNPEQLWVTTMNPANRILKQVIVEDAVKADRMFNVLMGDQVEPRKQFIQAHAASVKNLDV